MSKRGARNWMRRTGFWERLNEKRARAALNAPRCLDCPEITQPPHPRCNTCALAHHYRTDDERQKR